MNTNEKTNPTIEYDGEVLLATANKRFSKTWKNQTVKWSDILTKLSEPTITPETVAEYQRMAKDDRDVRKDVGGFVAAMLKEGKRNKGSVAWRSMITLDADSASPDLWGRFCELYDCAAAIYSTHSHRPEAPKFRILIPLASALPPGECEAVAHFIVTDLDVEQFDDSTYEPERLMYWPSTPKDGEYIFQHQDGPWLDAKAIINRKPEILDASTWEFSSRHKAKRQSTGEKAGDPREKPGVLGAFCRVYDAPAAIEEFLPDIYAACDNGRYTYMGGSTSQGVVIYDDGLFSYSNHGTDPAWGNHNAWDLVRIHKFGHLDDGQPEDTTPDKLQSEKAMRAWALAIPEVRIELANTKAAEAVEAFSGLLNPENPNAWKAKLTYTEKGRLEETIQNARLILRCDPDLSGAICYNELARRNMLSKSTSWRILPEGGKASFWTDTDDAGLREFLQARYKLQNRNVIDDAVRLAACENHFHPIREYLDGLTWDGQKRLDRVLIDYLGAEDNAYIREASRIWFTAAVARVRDPGCKFDSMLILIGDQGIGKSQFLARIARRPEWFSDSLSKLDNSKESMEHLAGKWIFEIGELAAMRKAETEALKTFLSKQDDTYRPSYGRNVENFPRQCVFAGSSNRDDFLCDPTGGRRFWPIAINDTRRMWHELKGNVIDQIWAEADVNYAAYDLGLADLDLSMEAKEQARTLQAAYTEMGGRPGMASEFLDRLLPADWQSRDLRDRQAWLNGYDLGQELLGEACRESISGLELFAECFGGDPRSYKAADAREMNDILRRLGWTKGQTVENTKSYAGKQRIFSRPATERQQTLLLSVAKSNKRGRPARKKATNSNK